MLRGSITALITPFANGAVDEKAFANLVDWQIREGTHGLVPVGTTGESPTVSHEEHRRVIEALDLHSVIGVPLIARGRMLGAWSFVRSTPGRPYVDADLQLAISFSH